LIVNYESEKDPEEEGWSQVSPLPDFQKKGQDNVISLVLTGVRTLRCQTIKDRTLFCPYKKLSGDPSGRPYLYAVYCLLLSTERPKTKSGL